MPISELSRYEQVWGFDFEFIPKPGERPDVVCLAAQELHTGQTITLWRDQLGAQPPFRTDDKVLFISFVANAEVACHLALGWPVPANILDLSPVFRSLANGRPLPKARDWSACSVISGSTRSTANTKTRCKNE